VTRVWYLQSSILNFVRVMLHNYAIISSIVRLFLILVLFYAARVEILRSQQSISGKERQISGKNLSSAIIITFWTIALVYF
jgi:hypothetical protein